MGYEIEDIGCRVIYEDDDGDVRISVKATVENNSDDDDVRTELRGVDKDGFELESVYLSGHVPMGSQRVLTETAYMKNTLFEQIVDWERK